MRSSYTAKEVEGLVEAYAELREQRGVYRHGLNVLVRLADLDSALARLSLEQWKVVLLYGLLGMNARAVGELVQKSQPWVNKRYRQALEDVIYYMNGGE